MVNYLCNSNSLHYIVIKIGLKNSFLQIEIKSTFFRHLFKIGYLKSIWLDLLSKSSHSLIYDLLPKPILEKVVKHITLKLC